ncbi:MAG TPA: hypothetical protein V6C89_18325 [Drouetiella sp.]|jgi:hypothetical protein
MNRDRVERVVTNELNGRELHIPAERLQREAQEALRGRTAHETNQNYRLYNEMAARAHLPQLALVDESGAPHRQPAHRVQPHRAGRGGQDLPVPPIPPGMPGSEAPITPPDNREPLPPTMTPRTNLEPTVNEPGAMPYRTNTGILRSEGVLAPQFNRQAGDYQFNPLNPPGLDDRSLSGLSPAQRFQGNGEVTSQYRGQANLLGAMYTFNSSRTTDAAGHILAEHVEYPNHDGPMYISGPNGTTQRLDNVRSIDTVYNPGTNSYRTEYVSQDGTRHVSTTDGNGRVTSFERVDRR